MKCIVAHQVPLGDGRYLDFKRGADYPESDAAGREKYFDAAEEAEGKEVEENDSAG